ncbi:MAG: hypothetical protein QGI68_20145 [Pseudomonadales bacterium]|nr:hypothetical protein [Pseudomonadales bacterium]MDP7357545.1 hypothetical protein [Pseudomonadales bacterium]MDP7597856.1 hypothetical protein [Pseudomonadales bacterium]HJN51092.1 hypothetical protein [Pseudomonadales bacterium]
MKSQAALVMGVVLIASAGHALSTAKDIPAVITQHSVESRAELLHVVSTALNGIRITLADDALTHNSLLTLERNPPRDLQNRQLTGLQLERPQQFRLVINGSDCILVHQTGRWHLEESSCAAE